MSARVLDTAEKDFRVIVNAINELAQGRSNAVGVVTLATGTTTTNVSAPTCGVGSVVILSPKTANAAALAQPYYTASNGSFVVTHASSADTDLTFGWLCVG